MSFETFDEEEYLPGDPENDLLEEIYIQSLRRIRGEKLSSDELAMLDHYESYSSDIYERALTIAEIDFLVQTKEPTPEFKEYVIRRLHESSNFAELFVTRCLTEYYSVSIRKIWLKYVSNEEFEKIRDNFKEKIIENIRTYFELEDNRLIQELLVLEEITESEHPYNNFMEWLTSTSSRVVVDAFMFGFLSADQSKYFLDFIERYYFRIVDKNNKAISDKIEPSDPRYKQYLNAQLIILTIDAHFDNYFYKRIFTNVTEPEEFDFLNERKENAAKVFNKALSYYISDHNSRISKNETTLQVRERAEFILGSMREQLYGPVPQNN